MSPRTRKAVIIGCGRTASSFPEDPSRGIIATHAGAYQAHPRTDLAAVCDADPARLEAFRARRGGDIRTYADYREMLSREKPDIVSVCTPPDTHDGIVIEAAKAGVPAVFCEKPVAVDSGRAAAMTGACRENGVILAVNHQRRWDPFFRAVKGWLDEEGPGAIQQVTCYYGAGIWNTGTHLIDLLHFFFGPAAVLFSESRRGGKDPDIDAVLAFEGGFRAVLQSIDVSNYVLFDITILGSQGRLRLSNDAERGRFEGLDESSRTESGRRKLKPVPLPFAFTAGPPLVAAVDDIVSCLDHPGRKPKSSGEDATLAVRVIEELIRMNSGRNETITTGKSVR